MSQQTYQAHRAQEDFQVILTANKSRFRDTLKNLRKNLYMLVDVTADAVWMALGNKLVKVRFPNTENL